MPTFRTPFLSYITSDYFGLIYTCGVSATNRWRKKGTMLDKKGFDLLWEEVNFIVEDLTINVTVRLKYVLESIE